LGGTGIGAGFLSSVRLRGRLGRDERN
jgi:hypothetical protein